MFGLWCRYRAVAVRENVHCIFCVCTIYTAQGGVTIISINTQVLQCETQTPFVIRYHRLFRCLRPIHVYVKHTLGPVYNEFGLDDNPVTTICYEVRFFYIGVKSTFGPVYNELGYNEQNFFACKIIDINVKKFSYNEHLLTKSSFFWIVSARYKRDSMYL